MTNVQKNMSESKIGSFSNHPLEPDMFDLNYPLGEIIYQKVTNDSLLSQINSEPKYVNFVNRLHKKIFMDKNSEGVHHSEYYTHTFENGTSKKYRFFGMSYNGEDAGPVPDSRSTDDYNMIMILIQDVKYQE